jgi:uncharacterized membrane protein
MNRILRHLLTTRWSLRRAFPASSFIAIEAAIRAAEREHSGEIRFAVEACLDLWHLASRREARHRALDLFSTLRVWDTRQNNGVLIYLLLADRDIQIVADRGFGGQVTPAEWEAVCRVMEAEFRAGQFEAGALAGIRRVSALIARHFPPAPNDRNELPDVPVVIT